MTQDLLNIGGGWQSLGDAINVYTIQYEEVGGKSRGKFNISKTEQADHINCVLLAVIRGRQMWNRPDNPKDSVLLCGSTNAANNQPDLGDKRQTTGCNACQLKEWSRGTGPGGSDQPPPCSEVFTLAMYDTERKVPFIFRVKRTAVKSLTQLKRDISARSHDMAHQGMPPHMAMHIKLTTMPERTYLVPKFEITNQLEVKQSKWCTSYAQTLAPQVVGFIAQSDSGAASDDVADDLPGDEPPFTEKVIYSSTETASQQPGDGGSDAPADEPGGWQGEPDDEPPF